VNELSVQLSLALGGVAPEGVKEETHSDEEAAPPVSSTKRVLTRRDSCQQFVVSPMEWKTSQIKSNRVFKPVVLYLQLSCFSGTAEKCCKGKDSPNGG
jgi:hypothetical protein